MKLIKTMLELSIFLVGPILLLVMMLEIPSRQTMIEVANTILTGIY